MKIAIGTLRLGEKFKRDTKYGHLTKIQYCQKHGYDLIEDEQIHVFNRGYQWSKIYLILKYLHQYDYFVWIDADTLIMNQEKRIEEFVERLMNNKDIMYARDDGWINTGVMFIKNTKFANDFFIRTFNFPNEMCYEQGAIDKLWRLNVDNCRTRIEITSDQTEYNSYWWKWRWGQFLVHFPSCGEPNRPQNCLYRLIALFCPIKMDEDDDESFQSRISWLKQSSNTIPKLKAECNRQGRYFPL